MWDKRYGGSADESVYRVFKTSDGFLLGGSSFSGVSGVKTQPNYVNNKSDLWFVKIDSLGNFQWDKVIGSLDDDLSMDMFQTPDHHYVIAAVNFANAGADKTEPTYGVDDIWLMKTDSMLNIIWDHSVGGNSNEDDFGNVYLTAEGNILLAGTSYSDIGIWKSEANNGPENTWVVLIDSAGNKIWDKTVLTGYTHCETGLAVQLQDGCYVFANDGDGFTDQEKTDMSYNFDYWCIKFCDSTNISQPPSNSVNFSATQQEICEKFCTGFIDSSANNPTSWQWLFPGGSPSSSTDQNPGIICYNDPGTYDVTLITTSASGSDTLTLINYITVNPTPPFPSITQNGNVLTSSPATSYQWQFNNADIPGATLQSYTYTQSGLYTVFAGDSNGCTNYASILITGVEQVVNELTFLVFPNPSNGNFTVTLPGFIREEVSIDIVNIPGQKVFSFGGKISSKEIDLKNSPEGVYFIEIKSENRIAKKKIIITK